MSPGEGSSLIRAWPTPGYRPLASAARSAFPIVAAAPRLSSTVPWRTRFFAIENDIGFGAVRQYRQLDIRNRRIDHHQSTIDPACDRSSGLYRRSGRRNEAPDEGTGRRGDGSTQCLVITLTRGSQYVAGQLDIDLVQGEIQLGLMQREPGILQSARRDSGIRAVIEQKGTLFRRAAPLR